MTNEQINKIQWGSQVVGAPLILPVQRVERDLSGIVTNDSVETTEILSPYDDFIWYAMIGLEDHDNPGATYTRSRPWSTGPKEYRLTNESSTPTPRVNFRIEQDSEKVSVQISFTDISANPTVTLTGDYTVWVDVYLLGTNLFT